MALVCKYVSKLNEVLKGNLRERISTGEGLSNLKDLIRYVSPASMSLHTFNNLKVSNLVGNLPLVQLEDKIAENLRINLNAKDNIMEDTVMKTFKSSSSC